MSDIKLFTLTNGSAVELAGKFAAFEKDLQLLIEHNMEAFLGVRFIKTEHATGKTHGGRIDSLGLDENGCPVIIEYKRHSNENVINQGLFYLDWLMDHQAEFQLLVQEKLNTEAAKNIEWGGTRLICIASDFNRYDEHAVQQINRNIELMRYRYFGNNLLLLELVNAKTVNLLDIRKAVVSQEIVDENTLPKQGKDKTHEQRLAEIPESLRSVYESLCDYIESLGDQVQRKDLKLYTAFKRIKNFASIVVVPHKTDPRLQIYLKLPGNMAANDNFTRDVTIIGHWGTGNFEITIRNDLDIDKAQPLIEQSYLNN